MLLDLYNIAAWNTNILTKVWSIGGFTICCSVVLYTPQCSKYFFLSCADTFIDLPNLTEAVKSIKGLLISKVYDNFACKFSGCRSTSFQVFSQLTSTHSPKRLNLTIHSVSRTKVTIMILLSIHTELVRWFAAWLGNSTQIT